MDAMDVYFLKKTLGVMYTRVTDVALTETTQRIPLASSMPLSVYRRLQAMDRQMLGNL